MTVRFSVGSAGNRAAVAAGGTITVVRRIPAGNQCTGYLAGRAILNEGGFLAGLDEEVKKELAQQLTDHLLNVRESQDKIVANREGFGSAVVEMAKAMVLLTKWHLPSHTVPLIEASKISGTLYKHLDKAIESDAVRDCCQGSLPGLIRAMAGARRGRGLVGIC